VARVVIHSNPHLANQVETAGWLREGFRRHGISAEITADRGKAGDIHVIQGPHYAYRQWIGRPNVLWLNRCYYGNARYDVSIGWLHADGSRDFRWHDEPRTRLPNLAEMKPEKRQADQCAMVFGDYGEDCTDLVRDVLKRYGRTYYRPHPAEKHKRSIVLSPDWTLEQVWSVADVAVGGASTALIDAYANGLHVECRDPRNPASMDCARETLFSRLTWADWHCDEIKRGEFWDHLCTKYTQAA